MRFYSTLLLLIISFTCVSQVILPIRAVGGSDNIKNIIDNEFVYPEDAINKGEEGNVKIEFTVNNNKIVDNVKVVSATSETLNEEALRIFNLIEWLPAEKIGKNEDTINQIFSLNYNIKKYKKLIKKRGYNSIIYPYLPLDSSNRLYNFSDLLIKPYPIFNDNHITLAQFIADNIIIPEAAIKQNLFGVVKIQLVIEKSGRPSNFNIVNSLGGGCNEEAIRLIKLIKWMPGLKNNAAVRTKIEISINFDLNNNKNKHVNTSYGE